MDLTLDARTDTDATLLRYAVIGLAGAVGFDHPPEDYCACCRAFWEQVADVLHALEMEVQALDARVLELQQASAPLPCPHSVAI